MWLRWSDQPWGNLLHGDLHAASLHDPPGPAVRPRSQGQCVSLEGEGGREAGRGREGGRYAGLGSHHSVIVCLY